MGDFLGQAEAVVLSAAPHEILALRYFLTDALELVKQSGRDPNQVTMQAGAGNATPSEMTPAQVASTTLQVARQHPGIVREAGDKYPDAQPLLAVIIDSEIRQVSHAGAEGETLRELSDLVNR